MAADYRNTLPSVHRVVSNSLAVAVRPSACMDIREAHSTSFRKISYSVPNPLSVGIGKHDRQFNPLKPELNPICYLLALLGAHHFLHVSRIRVKLLTFRLLMS